MKKKKRHVIRIGYLSTGILQYSFHIKCIELSTILLQSTKHLSHLLAVNNYTECTYTHKLIQIVARICTPNRIYWQSCRCCKINFIIYEGIFTLRSRECFITLLVYAYIIHTQVAEFMALHINACNFVFRMIKGNNMMGGGELRGGWWGFVMRGIE